jgi:hypothetical protein
MLDSDLGSGVDGKGSKGMELDIARFTNRIVNELATLKATQKEKTKK